MFVYIQRVKAGKPCREKIIFKGSNTLTKFYCAYALANELNKSVSDGEIFIAYASEADIKPSEDDIIKTVTIDSFSKMKYEYE